MSLIENEQYPAHVPSPITGWDVFFVMGTLSLMLLPTEGAAVVLSVMAGWALLQWRWPRHMQRVPQR